MGQYRKVRNYKTYEDLFLGTLFVQACGGYVVATDTVKNLYSHARYGEDSYESQAKCDWIVVAPPDHFVRLTFLTFDLEKQIDCGSDFVQVFGILEGSDRLLGKFCGNEVPTPIVSNSRVLIIKFRTDSFINFKGFSASYEAVKPEQHNDEKQGHNKSQACGGYLAATDTVKHFYSHDCNGFDSYENRANCDWSIVAPPDHFVRLTFLSFELESQTGCGYDFVQVFERLEGSDRLIGMFCGKEVPTPIVSTSRELIVKFRTDNSIKFKGFSASYEAVKHEQNKDEKQGQNKSKACGGFLAATDTVKHLYSHDRYGVDSYENRANCDWSIVAPPDYLVRLSFLTFELESQTNCGYDFVKVFERLEGSDRLLGKFCGKEVPLVIVSTSESLSVQFHTDYSINLKGFSASYQAVKHEIHSGKRVEDYSQGGKEEDKK